MLQMPRRLYDAMIEHCRRQAPKEACGLLAGQDGTVTRVYPMTNVDHSPISYAMDPREQLRAQKAMRAENVALLGIYHSHTASPAYPSPTDVQLAYDPEALYVVVSLAAPQAPAAKAFRIRDGRIREDDLQVAD